MSNAMDFSEALFCLKAGKAVRRAEWDRIWIRVRLDECQGARRFIIDMRDGSSVTMPITYAMVLAEDWEEVDSDGKQDGGDE